MDDQIVQFLLFLFVFGDKNKESCPHHQSVLINQVNANIP